MISQERLLEIIFFSIIIVAIAYTSMMLILALFAKIGMLTLLLVVICFAFYFMEACFKDF